jgi:hypothetical protein
VSCVVVNNPNPSVLNHAQGLIDLAQSPRVILGRAVFQNVQSNSKRVWLHLLQVKVGQTPNVLRTRTRKDDVELNGGHSYFE